MFGEIVAEALRERHAGGMPPSAKQEAVAASERNFMGQYLRESLAKAPVSSPAQAGVQVSKAKRRRPKESEIEVGLQAAK